MKIAIMQPYFFPYMPYFQLIHAVDKWVNLDHVTFIKQGYIHRNVIKDDMIIRAPCVGASSNTIINQVGLDFETRLWKKQLKMLDENYHKTPNYEVIKDLITRGSTQCVNISELNFFLIKGICEYLNIKTELLQTSEGLTKNTKSEGVMDIVTKLNGNYYINSIGGKELYQRENFDSKGIKLKFLKSELVGDFKSLSIFHIICVHSRDSIREKLVEYSLI